MSWVWLLIAIACEIVATLCLRASDGFRKKRWLIPVIFFYGLAFSFLGLALAAGMPVAIAYGIWAALGIALIAIIARVIWKDPLTKRMAVGIGLISIGVMLVELG